MANRKDSVILRRRRMKSGNVSLYLDIYRGGVRTYEYLRLYLIPEKSRTDKDRNRETLSLAEAVVAKRIVEIRNGRYGFESKKGDIRFIEYFKSRALNRSASTSAVWRAVGVRISKFPLRNVLLMDIDTKWFGSLCDFLQSSNGGETLSNNTVCAYISKIVACLNDAVSEGILAYNPIKGARKPTPITTERSFLTVDEVRVLMSTHCGNDVVRRAFLFSCFTGLRFSDIKGLKWNDITEVQGYTRITFRQKKTKELEYLDISPNAVRLLDGMGDGDTFVFSPLPVVSSVNQHIARWVRKSGISKKITFHCARHTFAVMMLSSGADIYTVSKLLGHSNLETTQIYAHLLDSKKRAAVDLMPQFFLP